MRLFKLKIQRKILLVIVSFTIVACAGLIYSAVKSLKLDDEHLALIEKSKNLDIEISHSRIFLDDYFLFNDTLKKNSTLDSFKKAEGYINSLDSFIVNKYQVKAKSNLSNSISHVNYHVKQLKEKVILSLNGNKQSMDMVILDNYNDFQNAYQKLEKNIHDYILTENKKFKKGIFGLVFLIFFLLILSLILVYGLINAYNAVEKKQAIKTIEVEYKERKRIAADLHDGLGSILSSIVLFVKLVEKDSTDEAINNNLVKVKELSAIALENLEAAINNLNPSILNKYGLIKSLEIICEKINDTGKVFCRVIAQNRELNCDSNIQINLYRICNELINNTLKHSGATELSIDIQKIKRTVNLVYKDNGSGFNPDLIYSSDDEKMGLRNMINRIESIGGKYYINNKKGVDIRLSLKV